MCTIIIVGSCNVDLISYVPRLPKAGETLIGDKFTMGCGGKGANQCIAAARLGANTAMVAKLGDDIFGQNFLKTFTTDTVNIDHVSITNAAATGVAPISVEHSGQNSIVIIPGANHLLSVDDVLKSESLVKTAKVVVCQLEILVASTVAALKLARKYSVRTILNPAPASSDLDPELFTNCDILVPNETEAEILTGQPVRNVEEAKLVLPLLLAKGCKAVVITLGEQGAVFAIQEHSDPVHVPAKRVKPVDTTGAGDSFVGSMAFYLSHYPGLSLKEVVERSVQIAAISVLGTGTQTSYPYRRDLPEELFLS